MKLTAAIIIIGDEILLGRVLDTNSGFISRALDREGVTVTRIITVGDKGPEIRNAVDTALEAADIVITTGGLGPTKDDITKRILLERFGGTLVRNDDVTAHLHRWAERRGMKLNSLTLDQALVPSSAEVMVNRFGSAPIMFFSENGKTLVTMPGVPFETEGMLDEVITAVLAGRKAESRHHSTFILTGITESALAMRLEPFEDSLPDGFSLAYLPDSPVIKLRLDGVPDERFGEIEADLERRIADLMLGRGEKSVGELVVDALRERGM
ncbi:MAG: competence/damage-inducible protein A, partial [Muribaculaceae bacterium]|nr:competence/damage-inducible protein A [Muribaculaceae bacterium]